MTDTEWALIEPHLPPAKSLGRPRQVRSGGLSRRCFIYCAPPRPGVVLPHDFPNRSTVQRYFYAWRAARVWETINFLLLQPARERAGREARPSAGVIDSQSVKTTESGGPRGGACPRARHRRDPGDAGKKINGRKRHILTDTAGHLVAAKAHAADIQDRDGAPALLASIRFLFPWLRHVFADGGYAGEKLAAALVGHGQRQIKIVKRSDCVTGFQLLPGRWVVERTFAWLNRNRRLAKDFETTIASSQTWVYLASVQLLTRLARTTTNRAPA